MLQMIMSQIEKSLTNYAFIAIYMWNKRIQLVLFIEL
jgi:hypothetical protein